MDRRIDLDVLKRVILAKDDLVGRLRNEIPANWPAQIHEFVTMVRSLDGLSVEAALTVLIEMSHEMERFASVSIPGKTFAPLDDLLSADYSITLLCERFEECLRQWLTHIRPGRLVSSVQAARVVKYIDHHFAERITLLRLTEVSGWEGRELAKMFKTIIGVSIHSYIEAKRIEESTKRLQQGDKVESVIASVGWRGRKNFFRAFKQHVGLTPAQYQLAWLDPANMPTSRSGVSIPHGGEPADAIGFSADVVLVDGMPIRVH